MTYKVKERREELGMSQVELSQKSGVSRTIISGLESGRAMVTSTDTLLRLARVLECSVKDILLD